MTLLHKWNEPVYLILAYSSPEYIPELTEMLLFTLPPKQESFYQWDDFLMKHVLDA